jgi:molybdopterin synthase sulfur carrier subunit
MSDPMIRVVLPYHLRNLVRVDEEVAVRVQGPITPGAVLDALEAEYPVLRGAIREHGTLQRRPFLRYFAAGQDWSLDGPDVALPSVVEEGKEPFMVVGAISGG